MDLSYCVYLLVHNLSNKTYIGCTNNKERRIRQHNGELVGGAKYTTMNKGDGIWSYYGYIDNLDRHTALSIEKKIQIRSRRSCKKVGGSNPLERRLNAIEQIINENNIESTFTQTNIHKHKQT